ncbi:MAG: type VI secretion system tube protein Hcp [Acidobacteriota bacterium]
MIKWPNLAIVAAVSAVLLSAATTAQAQQSIVLEFNPSVQGESTNPNFANQIDVLNASFGAANPACTGGKGSLNISEVVFTKRADRASVDMISALSSHQTYTLAKFRFIRLGFVYQEYQLDNAVLSSLNSAGSDGDPRNLESWTISFSRATVVYTYLDAKGQPAGTESILITPSACVGN